VITFKIALISGVSAFTNPNANGNKFGYPRCGEKNAFLRLFESEIKSLYSRSFSSKKYNSVLSLIIDAIS